MTRRTLLFTCGGLLVFLGLVLFGLGPGQLRSAGERAAALEVLVPTSPPTTTPPPLGETPTPTATPVDTEFMPYVADTVSTATVYATSTAPPVPPTATAKHRGFVPLAADTASTATPTPTATATILPDASPTPIPPTTTPPPIAP